MKIMNGLAGLTAMMMVATGWAEESDQGLKLPVPVKSSSLIWTAGDLKWTSFSEMNDYYESEFVKAEGFGIRRMPALEQLKQFEIAGTAYRVGQVQLVGIVDRDSPAVYQTHTFFKKESIKSAKSRKPTKAESVALAQLKEGQEWVTLGDADHILVGALRAQESCMKCHEGAKKNQLLGAFRYELVAVPKPQPAPAKSPKVQQQKEKPAVEAIPTT